MSWKRKQGDKKHIRVIIRNAFIRICKNCQAPQAAGSKSKKCWKCGKLVDTVKA